MKFTIAYTLLFIYVIAAILFWGYSLNKQSKLIYNLEKEKIELLQKTSDNFEVERELKLIDEKRERRTKQYWGEGSTFILITLLTAAIVYVAYYRQRRLSKLQENFMLSITHELKTPIAGIKLNMQTLEKRKLNEDTQMRLVKSSVQETNRLNDLCNNILTATQLDSKKHALYTEDVNLSRLILEQIDEISTRNPKCLIESHLPKDDFYLKGDASLWKLVVSNLIENARKYSPEGEKIEVVLSSDNTNTKLEVKDFGIGIPIEERKRIFEKFYRIGNENVRTSKGTGLGLFIVKKIIKLYKYDISVRNNTPKGSIFEVRFS